MKLRPETKLDKTNKTTSKVENDVMMRNFDIIVIISLSFFQFMTNPEAGFQTHSL